MIEKFSGCEADRSVTTDGERLVLHVDGESHALDRETAAALRDDLGAALTRRQEFFRTACEHREDGSYVVERRGAESTGHRKVFDSLTALERLYARLPAEFTADDVGRTGLTGGRRHMLLRHLAEHPRFDCELVSRQPLTVRKTVAASDDPRDADSAPAEHSSTSEGDGVASVD
ncbi:MAG: hypothetical protein ABEJ79_01835 [Halolamina sp.]